jgi:fibronectin type 3 domain-containing protein/type II secretory pathway pseudopilin PulG
MDMMRRVAPREAGLSLVELLVTLVVATMAFAAMVPFFIGAQQKNAADNLRTIALEVAQDKIEKIRQLDYDQISADAAHPITDPNLYNPSFGGGQFGPTYLAQTGGANKNLHIDYSVTLVPSGATAGSEKYKKVVVDVYWDAPPAPVKHVILQTFVYRQYAGPQIVAFDISPLEEVGESLWVTSATVTFTAVISNVDIGGMNAGGTPKGWIDFTANAYNGAEVLKTTVDTPVVGHLDTYRYVWDASGVPDGTYVFHATAFSSVGFEGTTASVAYRVEKGPPSAPTNFVGTPGDNVASLSWGTSSAGDLDHYEVWRSTTPGAETRLADDLKTPAYTDRAVTNGTNYYYVIKAVDDLGNVSAPSAEVTVKPQLQADDQPPTVPGSFTAAKNGPSQPSILLTWTASVDQGTPTSGLKCYEMERSANGTSGWVQLNPNVAPTAISYIDATAGYGATWYYRMRAVDNVGNASAYTAVKSATTDAVPKYTLTVRNDHNTSTLYVRVQSVATGLWYTQAGVGQAAQPAEVSIAKKGKTAAWNNLPAGVYNVFGRYSTTTTKLGDLSAGATTVVFP